MRESTRAGAWATDYVLTTAEFAAMCRWLLDKHRTEYIHVYTDDEPGSTRTGGHIFEGVMADSISYGDSSDLRFTARPRSEHWAVTEHISRIRSIEYNRSRFWHGDHGWVQQQGRLPKGAERPFFAEMQPYLIEKHEQPEPEPTVQIKRHIHRWNPLNKDIKTTKHCACGASKRWNSKRWVVKKPKV